MPKHAICSASSSARWIACPASAQINAELEDTGSPYSRQGTEAHSLCEYLLRSALGMPATDPRPHLTMYDQEMQDCADGYLTFVMEKIEDAKKHCSDPLVCVEQHLDFSKWVPEGFGTADCMIVADDLLHIIDYKHGTGIMVSAVHNCQLSAYALGALVLDGIYDIKRVRMSIYQPRRENMSNWEISKEDLLKWAETVLAPAAKKAYAGVKEFHAGDHCQFCKIKDTCREREQYYMELMRYELNEPDELSTDEIALILPMLDGLMNWATGLKEYALQQALAGVSYANMKLVRGKSNRKYSDEDKVAEVVATAGFDPYEKKILGITAMTRILGKKRFEELLGSLIIKPEGKPVLVSASDQRPALDAVSNKDFDDKEEN